MFTDDPVGQTKLALNLSGNVTNGQVRFSTTAPGYNISGSGILYLNPAPSFGGIGLIITNGAADQIISTTQVYFLTNQTWDIGGATTLTVTGTIEDAPSPDYALTKNGTGTLVFPGDVRYDGPTTINAGTFVLSFNNTSMLSALTVNGGILRATTNANALGNNPGSPTRNNITLTGGALELANTNNLTYGSSTRLTAVTGNATIRSDRLTPGPGLTYTLGILRIGTGTLSVAAGALVTNGTAGITFGTTTLTNNGAVFDVASGANLTLGALTGNFTFTNQGGGQLTLNTAANANRTSARVTLSAGTMRLGNASALGTAAVPLTLNGGTLHLAVNGGVHAHNTTVSGNATITSDRSTGGSGVTNTLGPLGIGAQILSVTAGTNVTSGTAVTAFGATTLSGNATFDIVSTNAQLTLGAVEEPGGARSLTKTGNGTLRLNGAGSYTGGTTLSQGAITLGVANALGSGGFNFAGGTLNANNTTDSTIGALTLTTNSTLTLSPGGAAATLTFAGVAGAANGILTIAGWSGMPGGLGTDDKIIFSGGTLPNADFLQHIHFDLGGGNIYPASLGAGGELHPIAPAVLVPDVVGLAQPVAKTNLVAANLSVGTISNASSANVPSGIVLGQNPLAGATVPPGTAISLLVSTGPRVPDVINLAETPATNAIINAGLSVGLLSQVPHGIVPAGFVISQSPGAGISAAIGTPVNLAISSGAPTPLAGEPIYSAGVFQLSVPTLTGKNYALEFSEQLPGTNWRQIQSLSGDDTVRVLTDSSATNQQRYYRVRMD